MKTIEQLIEQWEKCIVISTDENQKHINDCWKEIKAAIISSQEINRAREIMKSANINAKSVSEALALMVNLHDKADKEIIRLTSKVQQLEHQLEQATSKV